MPCSYITFLVAVIEVIYNSIPIFSYELFDVVIFRFHYSKQERFVKLFIYLGESLSDAPAGYYTS